MHHHSAVSPHAIARRRLLPYLVCSLALLVLLGLCVDPSPAADPKPAPKPAAFEIPYHLTDVKHVMVRIKVNGKGPFNMILDTGAPAVFFSTAAAKKVGLEADAKGWAKPETFELEGGLKVADIKVRVEDPFQLQGMNKIGLEGFELHGMIGYPVLAKYRIRYDFTLDKLRFEPLDFEPPAMEAIDKGKDVESGGFDAMVMMTKMLTAFFGKPNFDTTPRGFVGVEVEEKGGVVLVKSVLAASPAEKAGLKAGDTIETVRGVGIDDAKDLARALIKSEPGQKVKFQIIRGGKSDTLTVELGKGL